MSSVSILSPAAYAKSLLVETLHSPSYNQQWSSP